MMPSAKYAAGIQKPESKLAPEQKAQAIAEQKKLVEPDQRNTKNTKKALDYSSWATKDKR